MRRAPLLIISAPGAPARAAHLDRSPFHLGRDPDCELSIDFPWLSRRHLCFAEEDGVWHVAREGKNEVLLNGARLEHARLVPGDRLELGPLSLVFDGPLLAGGSGAVTLELPAPAARAPSSADRYLARLGDAAVALQRAQRPEEVGEQVTELALAALGARSVVLLELAGGRERRYGAAGASLYRVSRSLVEQALARGHTLAVADASEVKELAQAESIALERVGPALVAPLGPPVRGVLYLDRAVAAEPFTEESAAFAGVLAHLAGGALQAARERAERAAEGTRLALERAELAKDIERRGRFGRLVGKSAAIRAVAERIHKVAPSDSTVLITGETGAGKELAAREIHLRSARASGPFFAVNCAALPETLLESELFGHRRGAFSGADQDRRGLFELAQGGTIFLDEIGELSPGAQAKLLRVLEVKEVQPLGGSLPVAVDFRLLAATHRDLEDAAKKGGFRPDLLFRLNVFRLELPPLRERMEDLPALVEHLLAGSAEARRKRLGPPSAEALAALLHHDFPGNVRELAHVLEHAVIMADEGEAIDRAHLPEELARPPRPPAPLAPGAEAAPPSSFHEAVADFERALIVRELERDGWNRTKAAKRLQISRRAFMEKLRRYQIKEKGRPV